MRSKIGAGISAGLLAGLAFGVLAHLIYTPMAMGGRISTISMMARVVRSDSVIAGWAYLLVSSVLMGGIFGLVFGDRASGFAGWLLRGVLFGLVLWVLGALVLMPLLLGMEAFAPVTMEPMRRGAWLGLGAHLLSGLLLGGTFAVLYRRGPGKSPTRRP